MKKETLAQVFFGELCETFIEHLPATASVTSKIKVDTKLTSSYLTPLCTCYFEINFMGRGQFEGALMKLGTMTLQITLF